VGVSTDRSDRQRQFDEANDLDFPLLSDPKKVVARQFGVARFGFLPIKRSTFVIDTDRTVLAVIASETDMKLHADRALQILRDRKV
jgi:peroxiredoxin Q/BCP